MTLLQLEMEIKYIFFTCIITLHGRRSVLKQSAAKPWYYTSKAYHLIFICFAFLNTPSAILSIITWSSLKRGEEEVARDSTETKEKKDVGTKSSPFRL